MVTFDPSALAKYGRLTNMKRTLLHSLPAYHALMQWYDLFDEVKAFLGERLAIVFSHAISSESDCLICTTFMRRLLMNGGENPDALKGHEGHHVAVSGHVTGDSIHVMSVKML